MIDPVDLVGPYVVQQTPIERQCAFQVMPERFLDDHARPRSLDRAAHEARGGQLIDERAEILRIGRAIEQAIARQILLGFQLGMLVASACMAVGALKSAVR